MGFGLVDEPLHPPSVDPFWQESFWGCGGDCQRDGGCIHVGEEINAGQGNVWASMFAAGVAWRRVASI